MTHSEIIAQARSVCKALFTLLQDENTAIENKNVIQVEENLPRKDALAQQLNTLVQQIGAHREAIKADARLHSQLQALQKDIEAYDAVARQNIMLLRAAHASTQNFVEVVRDTIKKRMPKAETYGRSGVVNDKSENPAIINKSV